MNAFLKVGLASTATALLLCSCASQNDSVSFKSGGMTHTFVQGEAATKNFPLPLYPRATPIGSTSASGDSDDEHFMMLTSSDSSDKIRQFYETQLKAAGWATEPGHNAFGVVQIAAKKPGFDANVMISPEDKQTAINLSVSKNTGETPKLTGQEFTPDKLNPPTD